MKKNLVKGGLGTPKVKGRLERVLKGYMGGCQSSGPFLGTLSIRFHIIIGIQKRTIILTTIHIRDM